MGWFGVYDLVDAGASASAALNLLDCPKGTCTTEALQAASPVTYANHGDPPALLLHGTVDRLVADSQSREFARRLHEAGTPVELRLVEGAGHGWIGTDTAATVRYSRQALTATVEFLEHVLQTDVPRD